MAAPACMFTRRFFRDVATPRLVLHGDSDVVVPYKTNGRRAFQTGTGPRHLARLGHLPDPRDIVIEDIVNYHRHQLPMPRAGESVALDLRWGAPHIAPHGSAVLPGAMVLVGYVAQEPGSRVRGQGTQDLGPIPILGIPACGMYHTSTVFDLILPRILAGEQIGRRELAELGHGGLCLHCRECRYPVCPFGK